MMAVLNVLLLTCHLLAMNVASVAPLVAIWLHRRGRGGDQAAWEVGRRLTEWSVASLVLGYLFGFAQLGLSWAEAYPGNWDAVARISSQELGFIIIELLFSLVCLAIYLALWNRWRDRPRWHALFAILASANLMYHFPPLMTALRMLAVRPELASETVLTHDALRSIIVRPEVLSFTAHFIVASIAVAGVALMQVAVRYRALEIDDENRPLIIVGAWLALVASLAQLGIGAWVLVELPPPARDGLIGNDLLATSLFLISLLGAFALLQVLAGVALGEVTTSTIARSTLLMIVVVLLMTGALVRARELMATRVATLTPYHESLR